MAFRRSIERVDASALVEFLRSEKGSNVQIIDVRDSDFKGGHIRGAVNHTEDEFGDDDFVDRLVEKYKSKNMVVFHCMLR